MNKAIKYMQCSVYLVAVVCSINWSDPIYNTTMFRNATEAAVKLISYTNRLEELFYKCGFKGLQVNCEDISTPVETEAGDNYVVYLDLLKLV